MSARWHGMLMLGKDVAGGLAMRFWWLAGVLGLAACAGTIGVQQTGPDSFLVSEMRAPALGGGPAAQQAAIGEAMSFCASQGRVFVPITMAPGGYLGSAYGPTTYTASFRCLAPNDPVVARLRANRAPYMDGGPPKS